MGLPVRVHRPGTAWCRNEFAHNSDVNTLSDLPDTFSRAMRRCIPLLPLPPTLGAQATTDELFGELLFATLIELHVACAKLRQDLPVLNAARELRDGIRETITATFGSTQHTRHD